MKRENLLTSDILVKLGLKFERCGISGADMWQGMPIWRYDVGGSEIVFRGTFSNLRLAGYFNSKITTVGDLVDIIRLISGININLNEDAE